MCGQYSPFRILRLIYHLPNFVKLFWRLFRDPRVPAYKKALPVIAGIVCLAYVLFPFDALPDPYPLIGQIDDAVVTLLIMAPSIWLFIRICPKELVKEHSSDISNGASWK
jgi:uncharacterized membrane protein YkvA (DUF1232 family)